MIATIVLSALAYSGCVVFLRSALDAAPEAYEDESGFHYE
jgi:hypothetical protein